MNGQEIKEMAIKSCTDMYNQMSILQSCSDPKTNKLVAMVTNKIDDMRLYDGYVQIKVARRLPDSDMDNIGLMVDGRAYYGDEVLFDEYDDLTREIKLYPSESLRKALTDIGEDWKEKVMVISDMKWLISLTKKCFQKFGERVGYPREPEKFVEGEDYSFPKFAGGPISEEQKKAVNTILNSRISYVWGAPGTGKTQYVLATAILAHIKKGHRVAIIAPTNNSVEQVLTGVLNVINEDDPDKTYIDPDKDILRMGSATKEFMENHPSMCEDRTFLREIKKLSKTINIICRILFEREVNRKIPNFDLIERYYREYDSASPENRALMNEHIGIMWDEIKEVASMNPMFENMVDIEDYDIRTKVHSIKEMFLNRERSVLNIKDYQTLSDEELKTLIAAGMKDIADLEQKNKNCKSKNVKIVAMTPFVLMSRQSLFEDGGLKNMDQIFVDEAGYANLIQSMPVFMCGPPVAMLGDHMQLPPVCELDREDIGKWHEMDSGYMKYSFLWDQSLRFVERLFFGTADDAYEDYETGIPKDKETKTSNLTNSHRFADNLAKILDECVYHNNISGSGKGSLEIICYDVKGITTDERKNMNEAEAVAKFLENNKPEEFAVLCPYKNQVYEIRKKAHLTEKQAMSIHGSQGREWDTVIISVVDNDSSPRDVKLRFTSSLAPNTGLKVMNTAVSRAKKRLVIFCDYDFWAEMADRTDDKGQKDLLGKIVKSCDNVVRP